jgi:stage II sporulation protein D
VRALRLGALLVLVGGGCASPGRRPAPPPEPAIEVVAPAAPAAPTPAPSPAPAPLPPETPAAPVLALPAQVRIGLATDLEAVTLACCEAGASAEADGERFEPSSPVTVRPAAGAAAPPLWRLQLAAVREESEAATLARRLEKLSGARADARFDAASGLYRVRLGGWPTREAAEAAGRRLQGRGLDAFWVVSEGAVLSDPALEVVIEGRARRIPGRRFLLRPPQGGVLPFAGKRYRGALVAFLNHRGRLNLLNELPLEDYLRGVVPSELGPDSYPELEALKAQAVAARSYTLRNLNGFAEEGYDLCGTPKCQVYGGRGAEHPTSDRAVAATAGEVMVWRGAPIDALYSATCGGHTEDVEVVFPLKREPYLTGVSCIEAGASRLARAAGQALWPRAVTARAIEGLPERIVSARDLERAISRLAAAAGRDFPADQLVSLERAEVRRFLASRLDLALDPAAAPRAAWGVAGEGEEAERRSEADRALAAWLDANGDPDAAGARALAGAWAEELLLRLALRTGLVERRAARFDSLRGRDLAVRDEAGEVGWHLERDTAALRDAGDGPRAAELALAAGDPLELWLARGRLAAVVQHLPESATALERSHSRSSWTRFRSDAELAVTVRQRFPGFDFLDLDILARGISGRVGRLLLRGRDGATVEVSGLAVRWTLDLPDTLFSVRRIARRGAPSGWQFTGRGWGHGVGLCQYGAYSMARRGLGYRDLLAHYYPGARFEKLGSDDRRLPGAGFWDPDRVRGSASGGRRSPDQPGAR